MKLGEALAERARLQRSIGELRTRINSNAATQEGQQPAELPNNLITECEEAHAALGELIAAINLTNARTVMADGRSITEWLANRDQLAGLINTYTGAADSGQDGNQSRYMRSELALVRNVDVALLRGKANESSAQLRRLDNDIQEINWTTELDVGGSW